jgi:hypothetical protein
MSGTRSRHRRSYHSSRKDILHELGVAIWGPPDEACPKCKNPDTDYYDPFFFAPLRTLSGKRRVKCPQCGFIWRPSRSKRSILSKFNPEL